LLRKWNYLSCNIHANSTCAIALGEHPSIDDTQLPEWIHENMSDYKTIMSTASRLAYNLQSKWHKTKSLLNRDEVRQRFAWVPCYTLSKFAQTQKKSAFGDSEDYTVRVNKMMRICGKHFRYHAALPLQTQLWKTRSSGRPISKAVPCSGLGPPLWPRRPWPHQYLRYHTFKILPHKSTYPMASWSDWRGGLGVPSWPEVSSLNTPPVVSYPDWIRKDSLGTRLTTWRLRVHAITWRRVQVAVLALRRWQLVIKQVNHRPFRLTKESLEKRIPFIDPSNPLGLRNGTLPLTFVCQGVPENAKWWTVWSLLAVTREELGVNESALHRARKRPRRYEDGGAEPSTIDCPKVYYCRMYYQCVDAAVTTIQDRFHQEDYSTYSTLEQLLIKTCTDEDYSAELQQVTELYGADFNKSQLATQLQLLSCMDIKIAKESIMFRDSHIHFQSLVNSQVSPLAQVAHVVKFVLLMLLMPFRSEVHQQCVGKNLRSIMTQLRMNNVMVRIAHSQAPYWRHWYCCGIKWVCYS